MKYQELFERLQIHIEHAETKHQKFADIVTDCSLECCKEALRKVRFVNDNSPTVVADELLDEEYLEAMEAYLAGDKIKAIDECLDAMAVLARMIEMIEREM